MVSGRLSAGTSLGVSARAWTGWLEAGRELSRELPNTSGDACAINPPGRTALECRRASHAGPWTLASCPPYPKARSWSGGCWSFGGTFNSQAMYQSTSRAPLHVSSTRHIGTIAALTTDAAGDTHRNPEFRALNALAQEWRQHSRLAAQHLTGDSACNAGSANVHPSESMAGGPMCSQEQGAGHCIPLYLVERTCTLLDQRLGTRAFAAPVGHRLPSSTSLTEAYAGDHAHAAATMHRAATEDLAGIIASVGDCMVSAKQLSPQPRIPPDLVRSLVAAATVAVHTATWPQATKMLQGMVRMGTVGKRFLDRLLTRVQRIRLGPELARAPCPGRSPRQRAIGMTSYMSTESASALGTSCGSLAVEMPSIVEVISLLRYLSALHAMQAITAKASIGAAMQRLMLHMLSRLPALPGPAPLLGLLRDVTSCGWRHDREPEFLRRIADYLCTRAAPNPMAAAPTAAPIVSTGYSLDSLSTASSSVEKMDCDDEDGVLARPPYLHALTPSQVVEVLRIYARAGVHHIGLMEQGLDAVDLRLPALTPTQAAHVAEVCARFSNHRPMLMRRLGLHMAAHLSLPAPFSHATVGGVPVVPGDVAAMVASLARCRTRDERFLDAVTAYAQEHARALLVEVEKLAQLKARTRLGAELQKPKQASATLVEGPASAEASMARVGPVLGLGESAAVTGQRPNVVKQRMAAFEQPEQVFMVVPEATRQGPSVADGGIGNSSRPAGLRDLLVDVESCCFSDRGSFGTGLPHSAPATLGHVPATTAESLTASGVEAEDWSTGAHLESSRAQTPVEAPAPAPDQTCGTNDVALLEALLTPPAPESLSAPSLQVTEMNRIYLRVDSSMTDDSAASLQQHAEVLLPHHQMQDATSRSGAQVHSADRERGRFHTDLRLATTGSEANEALKSAAEKQSDGGTMHTVPQPVMVTSAHAPQANMPAGAGDSSQRRVNLDRIAPHRTSLIIRRLPPALQPRALLDELLTVPGVSVDLYYMPYDYALVSGGRPGAGCAFVGVTSVEGVAALARRLQAGPVSGAAELAILEYLPPANSDALLRALLNPTSGYGPPRTNTASRPMLLYVSGLLRGQAQPVELKNVEIYDMRQVEGTQAQLHLNLTHPSQNQMQAHPLDEPCRAVTQAAALEWVEAQRLRANLHLRSAEAVVCLRVDASGPRTPESLPMSVVTLKAMPAVPGVDGNDRGNSNERGHSSLQWGHALANPGLPLRTPHLLDASQLALIAHSTALLSYHPAGMLEALGQLMRKLLQPVLNEPLLATALLPAAAEAPQELNAPNPPGCITSDTVCNNLQNQQQWQHLRHNLPQLKSVLHTLHALAAQPNPDPIVFSNLANVCVMALSAWVPRCHDDEPVQVHEAGGAVPGTMEPWKHICTVSGSHLSGLGTSGGYTTAPAAALPPAEVVDVHLRLLAQTLAAAADHGTELYHPHLCDVAAAMLRHRLPCLRPRAACALLQTLVRLHYPPVRQLVLSVAPLLTQESDRLSAASLVDLAWSCARTGMMNTVGCQGCSGQGQVVQALAFRTRQLLHQLPTPGVVQMFWALAAMGYNDYGDRAAAEAAARAVRGVTYSGSCPGKRGLFWQLLQVLLQRYDISARDLLLLQEGLELRRRQQRRKLHMAGPAPDLGLDAAARMAGRVDGEMMDSFLQELLYRAGGAEVGTLSAVMPAALLKQQLAQNTEELYARIPAHGKGLGSPAICAREPAKVFSDSATGSREASITTSTEPEKRVRPLLLSSPLSSQLRSTMAADAESDLDRRGPDQSLGEVAEDETDIRADGAWAPAGPSTHIRVDGNVPSGINITNEGVDRLTFMAETAMVLPTVPAPSGLESPSVGYAEKCCGERKVDSVSGSNSRSHSVCSGYRIENGCEYPIVTGGHRGADALAVGELLRQVLIAQRGLRLEEAGGVLMRLQVPEAVMARVRARAAAAAPS